jgi:hypothetical protein
LSYVFDAPENDFKVMVVSLMESDAGDWMRCPGGSIIDTPNP